jgi:hypothetical protein
MAIHFRAISVADFSEIGITYCVTATVTKNLTALKPYQGLNSFVTYCGLTATALKPTTLSGLET